MYFLSNLNNKQTDRLHFLASFIIVFHFVLYTLLLFIFSPIVISLWFFSVAFYFYYFHKFCFHVYMHSIFHTIFPTNILFILWEAKDYDHNFNNDYYNQLDHFDQLFCSVFLTSLKKKTNTHSKVFLKFFSPIFSSNRIIELIFFRNSIVTLCACILVFQIFLLSPKFSPYYKILVWFISTVFLSCKVSMNRM